MDAQPDQQHMSTSDDDSALFQTDEQLDRRLRQIENGLADFEARIPSMRREVATIRRWLVRGEVRSDSSSDSGPVVADSGELPDAA